MLLKLNEIDCSDLKPTCATFLKENGKNLEHKCDFMKKNQKITKTEENTFQMSTIPKNILCFPSKRKEAS